MMKRTMSNSLFHGFSTSATRLLRKERMHRRNNSINDAILKKNRSKLINIQLAIEKMVKKNTESMENIENSVYFISWITWLIFLVKK